MDNQWKNEKCINCEFACEWFTDIIKIAWCRKGPPSIKSYNSIDSKYPIVSENTPACYCWREKEGYSK